MTYYWLALLHPANIGGHTDFANWLQEEGQSEEIIDDIFEFLILIQNKTME